MNQLPNYYFFPYETALEKSNIEFHFTINYKLNCLLFLNQGSASFDDVLHFGPTQQFQKHIIA